MIALLFSFFISPSGLANLGELQGFWKAECSSGKVSTQDIKDDVATLSETFYGNTNCEIEKYEIMTFASRGTLFLPEAPFAMDFYFTEVSLSLHLDHLVQDFNLREVCGKKDWQLNIPATITGLQCELFQEGKIVQIPKFSEGRFGIYKN